MTKKISLFVFLVSNLFSMHSEKKDNMPFPLLEMNNKNNIIPIVEDCFAFFDKKTLESTNIFVGPLDPCVAIFVRSYKGDLLVFHKTFITSEDSMIDKVKNKFGEDFSKLEVFMYGCKHSDDNDKEKKRCISVGCKATCGDFNMTVQDMLRSMEKKFTEKGATQINAKIYRLDESYIPIINKKPCDPPPVLGLAEKSLAYQHEDSKQLKECLRCVDLEKEPSLGKKIELNRFQFYEFYRKELEEENSLYHKRRELEKSKSENSFLFYESYRSFCEWPINKKS